MTKKDYVKLAGAIACYTLVDKSPQMLTHDLIDKHDFVRDLMRILAEDNPGFDRVRFWKACGLPEGEL